MQISRDIEITKKKTGVIVLDYYKTSISSNPDAEYGTAEADLTRCLAGVYHTMTRTSESNRPTVFKQILNDTDMAPLKAQLDGIKDVNVENISDDEKLSRGLNSLLGFFTEFNFTPNFRFVNTLALKLNSSNKTTERDKAVKNYITNYFELSGSPYVNEVKAKIKSDEFKAIIDDLKVKQPTKTINTRLKIYYGEQGTGKTTKALQEAGGKCIVCNASLLPDDLLSNFNFDDGKATFQSSPLRHAMENGEKIVLDEINLLPFDSLRALQGYCDGKESFEYKGETINIKPGFEIIGTMNLTVNGMQFALPAPLVDRCSDLVHYELTAKDLLGAF